MVPMLAFTVGDGGWTGDVISSAPSVVGDCGWLLDDVLAMPPIVSRLGVGLSGVNRSTVPSPTSLSLSSS